MGFREVGDANAAFHQLDLATLVPFDDLRGRIGCHIDLRPLDRAALTAILLSAQGPLNGLRQLFPGFLIQPSEYLIDQIVTSALTANLGARGLWPIIRDIETQLLYAPPTQPGEHLGVQFGWKLQALNDRLPSSVRAVLHAHSA